jgi:hypothetical protein
MTNHETSPRVLHLARQNSRRQGEVGKCGGNGATHGVGKCIDFIGIQWGLMEFHGDFAMILPHQKIWILIGF